MPAVKAAHLQALQSTLLVAPLVALLQALLQALLVAPLLALLPCCCWAVRCCLLEWH
jgi:hypothetical protein